MMKHYQTPHGLVAIEADGTQDQLIEDDWAHLSDDEADVIRNPPPTAEQVQERLRAAARTALLANDKVAIRCVKAGQAYPAAWRAQDELLREIERTGSGAIPAPLDYPPGT